MDLSSILRDVFNELLTYFSETVLDPRSMAYFREKLIFRRAWSFSIQEVLINFREVVQFIVVGSEKMGIYPNNGFLEDISL